MIQDRFFYGGLLTAITLLYVSFYWQPVDFWLLFPLSLFVLSAWSWAFEQHDIRKPRFLYLLIALVSGLMLYSLFASGKWFLTVTGIPLFHQLENLYELVQPTLFHHYIWLFIIIIPGEEWFWRGFIVKRLSRKLSNSRAATYGTFLYAAAHLVTGSLLLVLAAMIAGIVWSLLYVQTKNIWVPIISHLLFNLFLLILFPLI
jgi:membrane protease YdiL (CAAX protease family)